MNRMLPIPLLLALGVAAPAYAQADAAASAPVAADAADPHKSEAAEKTDWIADRNCLRHTGSHFTRSRARAGTKTPCAIGPGRAYTREDLDRTGATDLADALRRLDPAIR